jgi:hypothetical protein
MNFPMYFCVIGILTTGVVSLMTNHTSNTTTITNATNLHNYGYNHTIVLTPTTTNNTTVNTTTTATPVNAVNATSTPVNNTTKHTSVLTITTSSNCISQLKLTNKITDCNNCGKMNMNDCKCCKTQVYAEQYNSDIFGCNYKYPNAKNTTCNPLKLNLQKCKMECDKIMPINNCNPYMVNANKYDNKQMSYLLDCYNVCFHNEYNCPENDPFYKNLSQNTTDYVGIALGCFFVIWFIICFTTKCKCDECAGNSRNRRISSFNDV